MKKPACINQKNVIWLIVSALIVLCYLLLLAVRYDFWYDLNDDVLIKNITSGIYTGMPEAHNIQMQYPLSLLLSLLYRMTNNVPWYALFLVGVQALSIFLILYRAADIQLDKKSKVAVFITTAVILFLLLTKHMVIYQYTVSCAFLSGAAAFLILTGEPMYQTDNKGERGILTAGNVTAVMLLFLSFLIRSEMMLLTFPMVMVAILFRFVLTCTADIGIVDKARIFNIFKKHLSLFIAIVMGLILLTVLNNLGYSSSEWKKFNAFFDARTELYDFNTIPSYDGNETFYREIGMGRSSQKLLENYNFGLNSELDAQTLDEIAAYSKAQREAEAGSTFSRLKGAFSDYLRRVVRPFRNDEDETDSFWKMTVTVIYLLVFFIGLRHHILWKLGLLFACRTTLWMYIIYRNRVPVRISHSLYFVEFMVLAGLIMIESERVFSEKSEADGKLKKKNLITTAIAVTAVILFFWTLPRQDQICKQEENLRQQYSEPYDILFNYMEENPNHFYLMDVYSWVPYTERLFGNTYFNNESYLKNASTKSMNYDLMGGWAIFSPAADKKIQALGVSSMQEALLTESVYFVQRAGTDLTWLTSYYHDAGYGIVVEQTKKVGEFEIYRIEQE